MPLTWVNRGGRTALAIAVLAGALLPARASATCTPGATVACTTACGVASTTTCDSSGNPGPCHSAEQCNNCDDDGDGVKDNAPNGPAYSLTEPCGASSQGCVGVRQCSIIGWGSCSNCVALKPAVSCTSACGNPAVYACGADCSAVCTGEACNGRDDNCNGSIDEGGVCSQDCCPGTCAGKCGPNVPDGCGGLLDCPSTWVACGAGQYCNTATHVCACKPHDCTGYCNYNRIPDGCGGYLSCGACPSGYTCNANHECVCTPHDCTGYCGPGVPDGCGGTLTCPSCGPGTFCNVIHVCQCQPHDCTGYCGTNVPDGCGGTLNCSANTCQTGYTCSTNHQCCTSCAAQGKNCGTISDGCGGSLTCGTCSSGYTCTSNVCCQNLSCTGKCGVITNNCGQSVNCGGCLNGCCSETNVCVANCQ